MVTPKVDVPALPFSDHIMATFSFGPFTWFGGEFGGPGTSSFFPSYKNVPGFEIYLYFII